MGHPHLRRFDPAGSDTVHADVWREGLGHGLGEHVECGLRCAVVCVTGPGVEATERTHVDDSAVRGAEMRQSFARNEEGAASVGFEYGVPLGQGQALKGRGAKDGGVVDEDVETAKGGTDLGDGSADGGFGANIAWDGERTAAEGGDSGGGVKSFGFRGKIGDGDIGAGLSEGERGGAAQSASASCNEHRFAGERLGKLHKISLMTQGG